MMQNAKKSIEEAGGQPGLLKTRTIEYDFRQAGKQETESHVCTVQNKQESVQEDTS